MFSKFIRVVIIFSFIVIIKDFAEAQSNTFTKVKYYPDGHIYEKYSENNGVKEGPAITYYPSGATRSEDNYKNGLLDGVIKRYLENGKTFSINNFKNGKMDGLTEIYYPTGEKKSSEMFTNDSQTGICRFYYKNGNLLEESERVNGQVEGKILNYYENGQLSEKNYRKSGLPDGVLKKFTENGLWSFNGQYRHNKLSGINEWFNKDGSIRTVSNYVDGVRQGITQEFNEAGVLKRSFEMKNDIKHGIQKDYYYSFPQKTENSIETEPHYRSDVNIPIQWIKTLDNDELNGPMKLLNKDGKVVADFTYTQNKIANHTQINFDQAFGIVKLNSVEEENLFDNLFSLLLVFEDFDQIESLASKFRIDKTILLNGATKLSEMYDGLETGFGSINPLNEINYISLLNRWIKKYPESIIPRVLLVYSYNEIAYNYRGGGYAETVSDEGNKKFQEYIYKALTAGNEAMKLPYKDAALYDAMIFVGLGADLSKAKLYEYLNEAREIDPDSLHIYFSMSTALLPRWGGRPGQLENYINWITNITKEHMGNKMYAYLFCSIKSYVGKDTMNEFKFNKEQLQKGFEDILRDSPESFYILNEYASFATEIGDRELANKLFERISDRWDNISNMVWTDKQSFDSIKKIFHGDSEYKQNGISNVQNMYDKYTSKYLNTLDLEINEKDVHGKTSLMIAISNNQVTKAIELIKKGVDINIKDNNNKQAIHYAAETSSNDLMKILISKGAIANQADDWGFLPLHYAARSGFTIQIKTLLLIKNVNINSKSNNGLTALHFSTDAGHIDATEELLKNSLIDINIQDNQGKSPLHLAAAKGFSKLIEILLSHSADKTIKDNQGKTAADYAKENGHEDLYLILK